MQSHCIPCKLRSLRSRVLYRVADSNRLGGRGADLWGAALAFPLQGFRYRFEGKPKMLSLGTYPSVSLAQARQLAHAESNKVREACTHAAQYLEERMRMMQAWADYLDSLRAGADVMAFKRKAD